MNTENRPGGAMIHNMRTQASNTAFPSFFIGRSLIVLLFAQAGYGRRSASRPGKRNNRVAREVLSRLPDQSVALLRLFPGC